MDEIVSAQGVDLTPVQKFLDVEVLRWQAEHPNETGWSVLTGKIPIKDVVRFLMESTDSFVVMLGSMLGATGDVHDIALTLVGRLYDAITAGLLPFWAKPFAGMLRYVVVNVVMGNLIDYLIKQYKTGARVAMFAPQGDGVQMMQWRAE